MVDAFGSDIEKLVFMWLTRNKIPFEYQTSLAGGHFALGGSVVDFLLSDRMLAWRIQGSYWHRGVEKTGSDQIQKEMLNALGWTVVDLREDDLLSKLDATLIAALRGEEVLAGVA